MVYKGQQANIQAIGCPAHTFAARLGIALFNGFLWQKQAEEEGPDIGNQYTGCSMQTGGTGKEIKTQTKCKSNNHKGYPVNGKWQPENVQEINIGNNKTMQRRHFIQDKHL